VPTGKDAVVYGVIAGIATVYGVVLMRRFKAPEIVEGQRISLPAAARNTKPVVVIQKFWSRS
jgi:hypothetical protein